MRIEYHTEKGLENRIREIREMISMLREREVELIGWYNRLSYEDDIEHKVIDTRFKIHKLGIETTAYNDAIAPSDAYLNRYRKKDLSTERELT